MRFSNQLSIVAMTFCMMSCVATTSYFKTLPPDLVLPEGYQTVTLISAFDTTLLDFNQDKKIKVFSEGASVVVESLAKYLANETEIEVYLPDSILAGSADVYHESDSIDLDQRKRICKQINSPFIMVLESYSLDFYQDVDVVKHDDGSKTRTAHYDLVAGGTIHLYDKEANMIDSWYHEARYVDYDVRQVLSGLLAVGPLMAKAGKEVNELSSDIGRAWVERLSPSEVGVFRQIYTHKSLGNSTKELLRRDWKNAIISLTPIASSDDPKTSGRASHNLSVAFEALGDLESALKWQALAKEKLGQNHLPNFSYEEEPPY